MAIYFVSLISRENQPLYIQPFSPYEYNWNTHESEKGVAQSKSVEENAENMSESTKSDKDGADLETKKAELDAGTDTTAKQETTEKSTSKLENSKNPENPDDSIETKSFIDERTKENELLKYNFLSHMALDVFDSPFMPAAETEPKAGRTYNLLFVHDGVFVFGQETNTGMKIVLGCSREEHTTDQSERNLNGVFKKVNRAYLRLVCNPFITSEKIDSEIENVQFDRSISDIVARWNGQS